MMLREKPDTLRSHKGATTLLPATGHDKLEGTGHIDIDMRCFLWLKICNDDS